MFSNNYIEESKHYVTIQNCPEHFGLYPKAGKNLYSGWQYTVVYLYWTRKQHMFYSHSKQIYFINNNSNDWFP